MRLGTYSTHESPVWRAAAFIADGRLIDLSSASAWLVSQNRQTATGQTGTESSRIQSWLTPEGMSLARHIVQTIGDEHVSDVVLNLADVIHGPPVPDPGKFIAVGRNYMNHVREGQRIWAARGKTVEIPKFPAAFVKFASTITAQGQDIVIPAGVQDVDYELELAVVVGRSCRNVTEESALDYVAGYTICNDVGARQIQKLEMETQIGITLSKNFPTFSPLGPWLVTTDDIPDPQQLDIALSVNGQERQKSHTSDMMFSVAKIVSYWSQIGLEPGDIITTGTPEGVALARPDPAPFYLKAGDVVSASIERIGTLENSVR